MLEQDFLEDVAKDADSHVFAQDVFVEAAAEGPRRIAFDPESITKYEEAPGARSEAAPLKPVRLATIPNVLLLFKQFAEFGFLVTL